MTTIEQVAAITECYEMEPAEINDGYCMDWAAEAQEVIGGEVVWLDNNGHVGGHEHAVVLSAGRYYDAERPAGVTETSRLPWVRRNNDNARSAERYSSQN